MFSICVCAWDDLPYLKILYKGLKQNTKIPYEFIVHDNGSEDGTEQWLKDNHIKHTRSKQNEGVSAVNYAVNQSKYDFIIDINADMYPLPGWDIEIFKQIQKFQNSKIEKYTISSCLIEPLGNNPEYIISNHGVTPETFNEKSLLTYYFETYFKNTKVNTIQYSHPIGMPKSLWNDFRGVDVSYFPGYASDHDIAASAYSAGCRHFVMLSHSNVYHFVSKTLSKLPADLRLQNGHDIFQNKWGLTIEHFRQKMNIKGRYKKVSNNIL
jgi:glycosyltransferase involved in cell wall biosynthesis